MAAAREVETMAGAREAEEKGARARCWLERVHGCCIVPHASALCLQAQTGGHRLARRCRTTIHFEPVFARRRSSASLKFLRHPALQLIKVQLWASTHRGKYDFFTDLRNLGGTGRKRGVVTRIRKSSYRRYLGATKTPRAPTSALQLREFPRDLVAVPLCVSFHC